MNESISMLNLTIIAAQQSFIRRLVRIISETESVDDALRERITEESAESERIAKNALEG